MPTGYTQMIINDKVKTAKEFLHFCLRAFGVCSDMRDDEFVPEDDYTEKIRNATQADIDYHSDKLKSAEQELERIQQLTDDDLYQMYVDQNAKDKTYYEECLEENGRNNAKYEKMLEEIRPWECHPDCEAVKNFAVDQLERSKEDIGYFQEKLDEIGDLSRESFQERKEEFRDELLNHARWSVNFYKEEMNRAVKRQQEKLNFYRKFKEDLEKLK